VFKWWDAPRILIRHRLNVLWVKEQQYPCVWNSHVYSSQRGNFGCPYPTNNNSPAKSRIYHLNPINIASIKSYGWTSPLWRISFTTGLCSFVFLPRSAPGFPAHFLLYAPFSRLNLGHTVSGHVLLLHQSQVVFVHRHLIPQGYCTQLPFWPALPSCTELTRTSQPSARWICN